MILAGLSQRQFVMWLNLKIQPYIFNCEYFTVCETDCSEEVACCAYWYVSVCQISPMRLSKILLAFFNHCRLTALGGKAYWLIPSHYVVQIKAYFGKIFQDERTPKCENMGWDTEKRVDHILLNRVLKRQLLTLRNLFNCIRLLHCKELVKNHNKVPVQSPTAMFGSLERLQRLRQKGVLKIFDDADGLVTQIWQEPDWVLILMF